MCLKELKTYWIGVENKSMSTTLRTVFFVVATYWKAAKTADLLASGGRVFKFKTVAGNMKLPKLSAKYWIP